MKLSLEIDPNFVDAWVSKGAALLALAKFNEALECSDKALEIDPNKADAWYLKFGANLYLKRFDEGADAYNKALKLDPNTAVRLQRFIEKSIEKSKLEKTEKIEESKLEKTEKKSGWKRLFGR